MSYPSRGSTVAHSNYCSFARVSKPNYRSFYCSREKGGEAGLENDVLKRSVSLYLLPLRALCSSLSRSNASIGVCRHPVLCVLLHEHSEFLQTHTLINHRGSLDEGGKRRQQAQDKSKRQGP